MFACAETNRDKKSISVPIASGLQKPAHACSGVQSQIAKVKPSALTPSSRASMAGSVPPDWQMHSEGGYLPASVSSLGAMYNQ